MKPLFTVTAIKPVDLINFNKTGYKNEIYVQFPSCNIKISHHGFHPLENVSSLLTIPFVQGKLAKSLHRCSQTFHLPGRVLSSV
jgi:hypothetical protein